MLAKYNVRPIHDESPIGFGISDWFGCETVNARWGVSLMADLALAIDNSSRTLLHPVDGAGALFAPRAEEKWRIVRCVAGTYIPLITPALFLSKPEIGELLAIPAPTLVETDAKVSEKGFARAA